MDHNELETNQEENLIHRTQEDKGIENVHQPEVSSQEANIKGKRE